MDKRKRGVKEEFMVLFELNNQRREGVEQVRTGGQEFSFRPVKFEVSVRHPDLACLTVGLMNLEFS